MNTKEDQTPPAARPTPITLADEVGAMVHAFSDADRRERVRALARQVADLERQLAEAKSGLEAQREVIALQRGEIDKLRYKLAKSDHEIDRLRSAVDDANIAELNRQIGDANAELEQIRNQLREEMHLHGITLDERDEARRECSEQARLLGMSGEREARLIAERDELAAKFTKLDKPKYSGLPMMDQVLAKPNPEFIAWVASLPATYWTRYDLSAARIGWEAARTWNDSDHQTVRIARCREDNCGTDYIVDMERPDGSVVSVMVPKEGLNNHASRVVTKNDPENPFGLNLVCDGHYS